MDETKQAQGGAHFLVHISPFQGWGVGVILLQAMGFTHCLLYIALSGLS